MLQLGPRLQTRMASTALQYAQLAGDSCGGTAVNLNCHDGFLGDFSRLDVVEHCPVLQFMIFVLF